MASLNRIVLLGSLLSNPETKFSVEGLPIAKFMLPVGNGPKEQPGKIEVVCLGKLAEACSQMFKKDSNVLVEGRIQIRSFEEKAGTRKWVTEIIASNVQFADGQAAPQPVVAPAAVSNAEEEVEELPEDDLPF